MRADCAILRDASAERHRVVGIEALILFLEDRSSHYSYGYSSQSIQLGVSFLGRVVILNRAHVSSKFKLRSVAVGATAGRGP